MSLFIIKAQDEHFCHGVNCTGMHRFTLSQMSLPHLYPWNTLQYVCVGKKKEIYYF
jgi:hypothetical protein